MGKWVNDKTSRYMGKMVVCLCSIGMIELPYLHFLQYMGKWVNDKTSKYMGKWVNDKTSRYMGKWVNDKTSR